jgi:hypothetical protein
MEALTVNNKFDAATAIKGWAWIYGLSIVTNFLLNLWMRAAPVGGDPKMYWFDNACYNLLALWWCFVFAAVGNWPFSKIEGKISRGIVAVIVCWILGWLTLKAIYVYGGVDYVFPVIGNIYALLVFFCYTGENWAWAESPPRRQFFLILITIAGINYIILKLPVKWIPPWWFTCAQGLLATQLFVYLFRKMKQPMKSIAAWMLMFSFVAILIYFSNLFGVWDMKAKGIGNWELGNFKEEWLLFFMVWCAFFYGVLVPAHNWPFTKIRQPLGGILGCLFCTALSVAISFLLIGFIGVVFVDLHEAMTYGYMGVSWSFYIPLFFGIGFEKAYLWKGQKTPYIWDDVE